MKKEWQECRIQDVKTELNHMIDGIKTLCCVAIDLSHIVAIYDGKCWNKKIESEITKKLQSTYKWHIFSDYKKGVFSVEVFPPGAKIPYGLSTVYKAEEGKLYTTAGNFRIDAKNWQAQTDAYIQICNSCIKKISADMQNLDNFVNQYNRLVDELEHIGKTIQPETRDIIRQYLLFYEPIPCLF